MSKWIGLTDADCEAVIANLPGGLDGFLKGWGWKHFAEAIEALCRERNVKPERDEAEFDVVTDEMHCASACGPRKAALAEARNYALQYLDESDVVRIEEVTRTVIERFTRLESNSQKCAPDA